MWSDLSEEQRADPSAHVKFQILTEAEEEKGRAALCRQLIPVWLVQVSLFHRCFQNILLQEVKLEV